MKVIFIGCVQFSFLLLKELLTHSQAEIVGIITKSKSAINTDFYSLQSIAEEEKIPFLIVQGKLVDDDVNWMKTLQPDVIYCFGWSHLLDKQVLTISPLGVIGYHPAALPQNRGRHPIIWALVLGLTKTASTFFFLDEGADNGDIISQEILNIEETDDAASLYQKLNNLARKQVIQFTEQLMNGSFSRITQKKTDSNQWRKRAYKDGEIDWRMSAKSIHNLVRALIRPYLGAHYIYQGKEIKIWRTRVIKQAIPDNLEPGKVLQVSGNEILIKCGENAILLLDHTFFSLPEEGEYL